VGDCLGASLLRNAHGELPEISLLGEAQEDVEFEKKCEFEGTHPALG
jgi:hypothetical protein